MLQGVYSGVVQDGNGDTSDKGNINETFLRGVQRTNHDGIVQFLSIFPGHYTGRATHIHGEATQNYIVGVIRTLLMIRSTT